MSHAHLNHCKYLAHVANSGWSYRNFSQNFSIHTVCVREFFVVIVQYMVVSNIRWIYPTEIGNLCTCELQAQMLAS